MLHHPDGGGAGVQIDHIVIGDQLRGVPGDALLLGLVEPLLGVHVGLLSQKFAAAGHGAAVDLVQLALSGQGVQIPANGGLRGPGQLTQPGDTRRPVLVQLL